MNCPNILSHLQLQLHRHLSDVTHFVPYLTRIFGYFPPLVWPINFKGNDEAFFIYFFSRENDKRHYERGNAREKPPPTKLLRESKPCFTFACEDLYLYLPSSAALSFVLIQSSTSTTTTSATSIKSVSSAPSFKF